MNGLEWRWNGSIRQHRLIPDETNVSNYMICHRTNKTLSFRRTVAIPTENTKSTLFNRTKYAWKFVICVEHIFCTLNTYICDNVEHTFPRFLGSDGFIFTFTKILYHFILSTFWIDLFGNASFHQICIANGDCRKCEIGERNSVRVHCDYCWCGPLNPNDLNECCR